MFRERHDLTNFPAFSQTRLNIPLDMPQAKWVRLEVWDVAANGAFTQPVWIK